jgi:hypothetical protein
MDDKIKSSYIEAETTYESFALMPRRKVENNERKLTDFKFLKLIGKGTFGKVHLVLLNGKSYALKV